MSQLYHSEHGNVIASLGEELTAYRRSRKILHLPATRLPAQLFLLARNYPGNELPLRISVNDLEMPGLAPNSSDSYFWHRLTIPPTALVVGANVFEFWTDATAMNAWSIAIEGGHNNPGSYISTDGGSTWRNQRMGYLNILSGEYVVRVRLEEGRDPPPPEMIWEDKAQPRLKRLCQLIPACALQPGPTLERARALATWVSMSWEYRNTGNAEQYTPWDAETIIAWGQARRGHNGGRPIVMCVQYAVTFVTCCMAAGIPARCVALTGGINGLNGHFTSEVWIDELHKWVMVDANMDAVFYQDGMPLSIAEIQRAGQTVAELVNWGPGHAFQNQNPIIEKWTRDNYLKGICFEHYAVWPRTDFLSHPEETPPAHGAIAYSETNLVWQARALDEGFGMFPYFGSSDYFDVPPPIPGSAATLSHLHMRG